MADHNTHARPVWRLILRANTRAAVRHRRGDAPWAGLSRTCVAWAPGAGPSCAGSESAAPLTGGARRRHSVICAGPGADGRDRDRQDL